MDIYTAVIVEPRRHAALGFVLRNFLENLDTRWKIIVYHGNRNGEWLSEIIEKSLQEYTSRISLKNLGVDNLRTSSEYSKILTTRKFIEEIPTETFLVFQTDSMINPKYKNLIYKFIDYDYVGAPWPWDWLHVGNGGLSLRKRSTMLKILDLYGPYDGPYEDQFYSLHCGLVGGKKPERNEACEFSIEQIYNDYSFGMHKSWLHIATKVDDLCNQCEGLRTLIELQRELP